MSRGLDHNPLRFGVEEIHHRFNENLSRYVWLGYEIKSSELLRDLRTDEQFEIISSFTDFNNENSSIFLFKKFNALIFICQSYANHSETTMPGCSDLAQIAITANTFEGMDALISFIQDSTKDVEKWLKGFNDGQ